MTPEEARALITQDDQPRVEPFPTPEWPTLDGSLYVRGMTPDEQDDHEIFLANHSGAENENGDTLIKIGTKHVRARVAVKGLVTRGNERVYSDSEEHISQLGSSNNGAVVDRLYQKVRELSGLTKQAAEELEKNSETTPGNSSPST